MRLNFTIPGDPMGKQRPKFSTFGGHVTVRTPKKTVTYESIVRMEFERQCGVLGRFPDGAQIRAYIVAYYSIPKSTTKNRRKAMMAGQIRPTKRPDCDNVIKIILDALNGVAYRDDAQVVTVWMNKHYDDVPRVEVFLDDGFITEEK